MMKDAGIFIYPKAKSKEEIKKAEKALEEAKKTGKTADLPPPEHVYTEVECMKAIESV